MSATGKILILIGIIFIILGVILWLGGNRLGWLGNLPGDLKLKRENFTIYFPLATMLLLSFFLSGLIWLVRNLFR